MTARDRTEAPRPVAVLFGGRSTEHEISIITALQLCEVLDAERWRVVPVYVAADGRWFCGDALLDRAFYAGLPGSLARVEEVTLLPKPGVGGLLRLGGGRGERVIPIDVALPLFHGTYGEDGCVQGLFELADLPYAGSGVLGSALGMDKHLAKEVAAAADVPVLPGRVVDHADVLRDLTAVRARLLADPRLRFPLIVKPCRLGSSIGVSRAPDERELDAALLRVFEVDDRALVEPCLEDFLDLNVAVLAGVPGVDGGRSRASVVEIPCTRRGQVLAYEDKYLSGGGASKSGAADAAREGMASAARVIDPRDLDLALKQRARALALRVFERLECAGVARVDFLLDAGTGELWFNEINTLPGSLAFYLWVESDPPLVYTELVERLLAGALSTHRARAGRRRDLGFRALAPRATPAAPAARAASPSPPAGVASSSAARAEQTPAERGDAERGDGERGDGGAVRDGASAEARLEPARGRP